MSRKEVVSWKEEFMSDSDALLEKTENQKVLLAISGGVDSSAAIAILQKQGFQVVGLYIDMLGDETSVERVRRIAGRFNIELVIEDAVDLFQKNVIEYTITEHQRGRTPSPCVRCNHTIKWTLLKQVADRRGIFYMSTGHYIRICEGRIYRGADPVKDQSYYLWSLPVDILRRALTPLGNWHKQQVREFVDQLDLNFREEKVSDIVTVESMSLCFVKGGSYGDFLGLYLNSQRGDVVSERGEVIGAHEGFQRYTIGQKRGFTGGGAVIGVVPKLNQIIVTDDGEKLYYQMLLLSHWVLHRDIDVNNEHVDVAIRGLGRNPESGVKSIEQVDGMLKIELNQADAWAVAVGQPAVLYVDDEVVGGGIVERFS